MYVDPSGYIREGGYYTINGVYGYYADPDAAEFGKNSDTYKILVDLGNRWTATSSQSQRDEYHDLAERARKNGRIGTPYMYGQNVIIQTLHNNADIGLKYRKVYDNAYDKNMLVEPYIWFVAIEFTYWNYKYDDTWRLPQAYLNNNNFDNNFDGIDLTLKNVRNWIPWIYFDGKLWSADKFSNMNLGYVGIKMGYDNELLLNFETKDEEGDIYAINYGISLAKRGR